jgi:hypothetical protein
VRPLGRPAAAALVALAALVTGAGPASADPPGPSDYRSTVTAIEPASDRVEAEVVGGDSFLELRVDGAEVVVPGYNGEPYLRFLSDGTVERNVRSPATYLNDDRQGAVDLPPEADGDAEPEWEQVADGGAYAWHDHRIHWMGTSPPPGAEPGEIVQEWVVPIEVDGTAVEIRGELQLAEEISPLPWILLALAGLALVALACRRQVQPVAAAAATATSAAAFVVGWAEWSVAPAGSGTSPLPVVVPLIAFVAGGFALAVHRRQLAAAAVGTLASAAALLGWGILRADVLTTPVLPTELPFAVDRAVTALAIGVSVAVAGLVVWSGDLALRTGRAPAPPVGATGAAPAPDGPVEADRASALPAEAAAPAPADERDVPASRTRDTD